MLRIFERKTFHYSFGILLIAAIASVNLPWTQEQPQAAANIRITPEQFSQYNAEWSEPEGYFDTDNFISNETSYLHVIGELRDQVKPGGVYLGVGPDQNFSYIVHTRPEIAVIVDIRRQNMLQLLLYRAIFSMASNRAEYLSLLFSKERTLQRSDAPLPELLATIRSAKTSEAIYQRNLSAVKQALITFKVPLTKQDLEKIEYVYQTFWLENLDLRFSSLGRGNRMQYPTFEEILLQTDRQRAHQNYLASEESFQWLKQFHAKNRLIPVTGDFAGSHAFRALAAFLKQNGLLVSTFYTSNVEFYLFGRETWSSYMSNVQQLPMDARSVMIRADFTYNRRHPENVAGHRSTSVVHSMKGFVDSYKAGEIRSYWNVVVQ